MLKKIKRRTRRRLFDIGNKITHSLSGVRTNANHLEIRLLGMMRSGNHALVNWIYQQVEEPRCFLNNVDPGANPFTTFQKKGTYQQFQEDFFEKFNLTRERLGSFSSKNLLMYSYEDRFPEETFANPVFLSNHQRWVGGSETIHDLLLIRDPFNLFASRLKQQDDIVDQEHSLRTPEGRDFDRKLWKSHAREYLGETNHSSNHKVLVSYNQWVADESFRKDVSAKLGLHFNDTGLGTVVQVGGGSSFDRDGNVDPAKMKVAERWTHYAEDADYLAIFDDSELLDLSRRIFGDLPGTETIANAAAGKEK